MLEKCIESVILNYLPNNGVKNHKSKFFDSH